MRSRADKHPDSGSLYEKRQMAAIAARWGAKAAGWDSSLQDPECHLNEDKAYERFLAHLSELINERREFCGKTGVIDAGCATGLVLAKAIPYFAWGIGVDISPEMIEIARSKNIPKATFVLGDCFDLAVVSEQAGAVISRGVLLSHYGPAHAKAFLRSALGVLVPGGFLLCDFLNRASQERYKHFPENKSYFSSGEICELAKEAGFQTGSVRGEEERRVRVLLAEVS